MRRAAAHLLLKKKQNTGLRAGEVYNQRQERPMRTGVSWEAAWKSGGRKFFGHHKIVCSTEDDHDMAIYHLEAKVITRGDGRTVCGAAAYMSCSRIYNDYDGIQHDYARKGGLVWKRVFLPSLAPAEWQERETLWNAVEDVEKAKDSRLDRRY